MSTMEPLPQPTPTELSILRVLWQRGSATVREVYEDLNQDREMGYTTVLKLLQIMTEKGTVVRNEMGRAHVYQATQPQSTAQTRMVGDLVNKMFNGSAQQLVMHALNSHKASPQEMAEIRRLLDEMERGNS